MRLGAALDDEPGAAAPEEWVLSRICEEFSIPPSAALQEDSSLVFTIMEMRSFARAKEFIDRPETDEKAIKQAGLSERLVGLVFEAKSR